MLSMSVLAVVPVKSLLKSKTRLSAVLSSQERRTLTLTMLEDVLTALKSSMADRICVISSDSTVQALANKFKVEYLSENQQGLNQAIEQATEWCIHNDAKSVLVLPADVPLIASEDINQIIKLSSEEPTVVISSSQNGGTNALLQKPPNLIPVCFGPHSFMKHVWEASAKSVVLKLYTSSRVSLDIDSSEDIKNFLNTESQTVSRRFLEQTKLHNRFSDHPVMGGSGASERLSQESG